jgi:hypothetical protein
MSRTLKILCFMGAILAAVLGLLVLRTAINMGSEFGTLFAPMPGQTEDTGSGGLGAVSVGVSEPLVLAVFALIPSAVINRILVRRALLTGTKRSLYRTHSVLLLLIVGLIAIPLVLGIVTPVALSAPILITLGVVLLFAVGVQFLVLAAMLMMAPRLQKH